MNGWKTVAIVTMSCAVMCGLSPASPVPTTSPTDSIISTDVIIDCFADAAIAGAAKGESDAPAPALTLATSVAIGSESARTFSVLPMDTEPKSALVAIPLPPALQAGGALLAAVLVTGVVARLRARHRSS